MYNTETVGSVTYYVLTAYFIRPGKNPKPEICLIFTAIPKFC